jgi:adenylate kinase
VAKRLRVYRDETAPLAAEYGRRGLLRTVDGSGEPDAVFAKLLSAVGGVAV